MLGKVSLPGREGEGKGITQEAVLSLKELLETAGEQSAGEVLCGFKCSRGRDTEEFLRIHAIPNERGNKSRTFLMVADDPDAREPKILAFFTLAIGIMVLSPDLSNSKKKRLAGLFYERSQEIQIAPCYLIGQIGKSDECGDEIGGGLLIDEAMEEIMVAWDRVGGRFVKIDCRDSPGLVAMYAKNGFEPTQKNSRTGLMEMVRFL
jgi:hypothetical protein